MYNPGFFSGRIRPLKMQAGLPSFVLSVRASGRKKRMPLVYMLFQAGTEEPMHIRILHLSLDQL